MSYKAETTEKLAGADKINLWLNRHWYLYVAVIIGAVTVGVILK